MRSLLGIVILSAVALQVCNSNAIRSKRHHHSGDGHDYHDSPMVDDMMPPMSDTYKETMDKDMTENSLHYLPQDMPEEMPAEMLIHPEQLRAIQKEVMRQEMMSRNYKSMAGMKRKKRQAIEAGDDLPGEESARDDGTEFN